MTTATAAAPPPALARGIDPRLSLMMFLHYCVWGIWMPIIPLYLKSGLNFTEDQVALIAGVAGSVGALASPFIGGQIADRYFSTERYLGVTMLLGGVVNIVLARQTSVPAWVVLSTIYALLYMPTLGLTNSLAMAHLSDPRRQFSLVRVWGTIAWITVAWVFPMLWLQTNLRGTWLPPFLVGDKLPGNGSTMRIVDALYFSGGISIVYGVFCFFLPHTPPRRDAVEKIAFAKVFALSLRMRSLLVLIAAATIFAAVHKVYFVQTAKYLASVGIPEANVAAAMSVGQFAEIAVMIVLGLMVRRLGFKWLLTLGAGCYVLRFLIFGTPGLPLWLIVTSQLLHGVCFACAWVGGYIYIDRLAPADVRHSMQATFNMVTVGVGFILGSILAGRLGAMFESTLTHPGGQVVKVINYTGVWYTCAAVSLVAALLLAVGFRDQTPATHAAQD